MGTTKLKLYNGALVQMGERKLSSLTEESKSRRILDEIWDDSFVDEVLQMGQWNHAARTATIDIDPDVEPSFGYENAFAKPSDWIRTMAVAEDEYFLTPLRFYEDELNHWYANVDVLYVKWVSNSTVYGNDLTKWPPNFVRFVKTYLASLACMSITQSDARTDKLEKMAAKQLIKAKSTDAMNEPARMVPAGSWERARHGRYQSEQRRSD